MSGSGFTGQFTEGDDEDSLSPEACYECKINGGGKNGRHKRNTDENDITQVESAAAPGSDPWRAAKDGASAPPLLAGCSKNR